MGESRVDILLALKSKLEGDRDALDFLKQLTGGLTASAIAYKVADFTGSLGRLASDLKSLAAEANLSTDAFQALKINAMGFSVNQETIVRGAVMLRNNLESAVKDGANPLNAQLEKLHLTAAGLQALAPERQFEVLGRAIATATDKEAAFKTVMDALGAKSAPKLIEMLKELGVQGFDSFAKNAKAITLSKEQIDALDQAANNWERMAYSAKILAAMGFNALSGKPGAPNPAALGTQIDILQKRIASFQAHGLSNDPRTLEYQRTLAILQARLKTEEDITRTTAETAKNETSAKMQAAELKDLLDSLEKSGGVTRQKIAAQDQDVLNKAIADTLKSRKEEEAALEKEADRFKNLADPLREYRLQLEQIEVLKARNLLSDIEAAAATKAVTQAMMERSGELGAHTKKLSDLAEQRQLVEGNPFLSIADRQSQLALILQAENSELDKQIALLRQKAILTPGDSRQLDSLVHQRTSNQFNPAGFSFNQQVGAGVMEFANSFGTQAQQTARLITSTIGQSVDSVGRGIAGWMTGTTTWGQVLQQLESGVLTEIINFGLRLGTQMLLNATVGKSLQAASVATTLGTTAATAAGISALMIAPATLATIASFGAAAAEAPFAIMTAMAASAPLGLMFNEGGHTGPGGVVHADEWVAPNWMVEHPVYGGMIDSLESARTGSLPAAAVGATAADKPQRFIHVMAPDLVSARRMARDPEFDNVMLDWAHRNRGALVS